MIKKYGLIGYPLSHSFSPAYFAKKFEREGLEAEYKAYSISTVEQFLDLISNGLVGINVTIPYKEQVIPFLDRLEDAAAGIGAVNTIKKEGDELVGYNTDVFGFSQSIKGLELPFVLAKSKALILGTGGASKAVRYALDSMGLSCTFVSRSKGDLSYAELDAKILQSYSVIVNTTPLGMYPNDELCPPIPMEGVNQNHLVYDLVYNPDKTVFLNKAELNGAVIKNGAEMLVLQAEKSWEIWNSIT